jgi:MoaA/NifB/PqqE/SkfB family radical SAM enzyme
MTSPSWFEFRKRLSQQAAEKGIPISGIFELTARCNLQCKMCYICKGATDAYAQSKEHTCDEWIKLAKEARDAGMLYTLLTGGEVFLRSDFREIYEEISMMGLIPTIYTNATLVTPEIISWIKRTPPEKIEVTLYGSSALTYQKVCGHGNGYEKTVKGIDALLNAGINIRLKTTVIPENRHDYDDLMRFAEDRNLTLRFCFYISPRRNQSGIIQDIPRLSPADLAVYLYRASEDYRKIHPQNKEERAWDDSRDVLETGPITSSSPFKCSAGKSDAWITWEGRMVPCGLMNEPHTLPFESGFQTARQEMLEKLAAVPLCKTCSSCALKETCLACPARLKTETGYYDKPASYLCELAKQQQLLYPRTKQ